MKFNRNLDWFKESDEDFEEDELDQVDEELNEGLYVDPSNYDKHSDLVDVVDKAGNPQKMTQATYDKNKDSGEFKKKEPEEKDKEKEPDRLSEVIDNLDTSKELQDNRNYSFIKANLPKDPLARETKLIEIGNKYKDKDLRRKGIWVLLSQTNWAENKAMAKAMGLDMDGLSAREELDKIVDNLDFEKEPKENKEPVKKKEPKQSTMSKENFNKINSSIDELSKTRAKGTKFPGYDSYFARSSMDKLLKDNPEILDYSKDDRKKILDKAYKTFTKYTRNELAADSVYQALNKSLKLDD